MPAFACSTWCPKSAPCCWSRTLATSLSDRSTGAHRFANAALNWLAAIDAVTGFCRNSSPCCSMAATSSSSSTSLLLAFPVSSAMGQVALWLRSLATSASAVPFAGAGETSTSRCAWAPPGTVRWARLRTNSCLAWRSPCLVRAGYEGSASSVIIVHYPNMNNLSKTG